MNITDLQREIGATPDGIWGPKSTGALLAKFTNTDAPTLSPAEIAGAAVRLGCSIHQIDAVRKVEAAGRGFDAVGRPKILFERHRFHKLTGGRYTPAPFSQRDWGGYDVSSWTKLCSAIATGEVDAAFQSASWGAFQVMGEWWDELGYRSPYALAWSTAQSEGDQLELLIRYIEHNRLQDELAALTSNPETCRAFAAAYNGPSYRKNRYDEKLAQEMAA
ncbi:N-acetylmuramidase domain-containing protein [Novosphingobium olei]|uniref:N-acetylmuramidase family protein n=1 Tax=Novosphingobium olei TaxID=2728851 RepID=A0A7Y0G950_9SPHN|nr:N-acetylmuramidase domain-containing protein [Novosphingobium olei]NML93816.1 N-acetylmuramidase family protein [Novosphingobium olei]